jgi:hypothetical protein
MPLLPGTRIRPLQNDTKVVISSSPGLLCLVRSLWAKAGPGDPVFPRIFWIPDQSLSRTGYGIRNDAKRNYSKVSRTWLITSKNKHNPLEVKKAATPYEIYEEKK